MPRYATYINTDTSTNVTTLNLGIPGWHSGDLLSSLQNDPIVRNQVSGSEVVTWDIGGTISQMRTTASPQEPVAAPITRTLRTAVSTFETNLDAILVELLKLRDPSKTILRTMDIYNPYVAADMKAGIFTTIEPYLDEVNNHIHSNAQTMYSGRLGPSGVQRRGWNAGSGSVNPIAVDGFHPNDAGHKVIADQLRTLAYAPLH